MHLTQLRPESLVVAAGRPDRVPDGPVNQPMVLASTFHAGGPRVYGRDGNDTIAAFEAALGAVEGGRAIAFSSGMAASSALIEGLPAGSVVVLPDSFYNFHRTLLDTPGRARPAVGCAPWTSPTPTRRSPRWPGRRCSGWSCRPTRCCAVPDLPALTAAARQRGVLTRGGRHPGHAARASGRWSTAWTW